MPLPYHRLRPFDSVPASEFSLLGSAFETPNIRGRMHAICALYAYTPVQERRAELLDALEDLTLEVAHLMALDLLENGWRPDPPASSSPAPWPPARSEARSAWVPPRGTAPR